MVSATYLYFGIADWTFLLWMQYLEIIKNDQAF